MPFDTVVSIGGQSFVDGLWRILGPALQGLTNPLPVAIPGLSNAKMRITNLIPDFPGNPPPSGALRLRARVELIAEAVLYVLASTEKIDIALGPQAFDITSLTGNVDTPAQNATISNLLLSGGAINLGPGTGSIQIPPVSAPLSGVTGTGSLNLPDNLPIAGIPIPAVVPVALDLTPTGPLSLDALVVLTLSGPNSATRSSLRFDIADVVMGQVGGIDPNLSTTVTSAIDAALAQVVAQINSPHAPPLVDVSPQPPGNLPAPRVNPTAIEALLASVPNAISTAFDDALSGLVGETGRLLYPSAGAGASCGAELLPTTGNARLAVTNAGSYVLQIGLERTPSVPPSQFPTFTPSGAIDTNVLVGNDFLLRVICCLVERLPGLSCPNPGVSDTVDVADNNHRACCNLTGVTANFGGFAIGGGGLSVCLDGEVGRPKRLTLVGRFRQNVPSGFGFNVAAVEIDFTLPLAFDLDDAASVADLRLTGVPTVVVAVNPNDIVWLLIAALGAVLILIVALIGGIGGWIAGAVLVLLVPIAVLIVWGLIRLACGAAGFLLNNAVSTLLSAASLLKSVATVPPGVFDAFGKFASSTEILDDLTTFGVLHTPTSPWALLPRIGSRRTPDKPTGGGPVRDPKAEWPRPTPPKPPGTSPTAKKSTRRKAAKQG